MTTNVTTNFEGVTTNVTTNFDGETTNFGGVTTNFKIPVRDPEDFETIFGCLRPLVAALTGQDE